MSSESSAESDSELYDPIADELHNVQLVKHVTRENIDALNAKFANLQEPPAMYLTGGYPLLLLQHTHTHTCTQLYYIFNLIICRIPRVDIKAA